MRIITKDGDHVDGVYADDDVTDVAELVTRPVRPREWISRELGIAKGGNRPFALVGADGSLKSWFAMAMQICGAASIPFLGFDLKPRLSSIYFDWDQYPELSRERYMDLARGYGVAWKQIRGLVEYKWEAVPSMGDPAERHRDLAVMTKHADGRDLAFVDSISAASGDAKENGPEAARPLRLMGALSRGTGAAFGGIDHVTKAFAFDAPMPYARGSGAKKAASGALFVFAAAGATNENQAKVRCCRNPLIGKTEYLQTLGFEVRPQNGGVVLARVKARPAPIWSAEEMTEVKRRLRITAQENPGTTGNGLHYLIGGNRARNLEAILQLRDDGELVSRGGTKDRPRWYAVPRNQPGSSE
jgi:hypothetical protein